METKIEKKQAKKRKREEISNENPSLEYGPKTLNIIDYDPSYKTINHMLSYRLDLLFFLYNLSCMPVLILDKEEDINLKEYNKLLLQIQLQLQSYILQQYILVTSTSKLMEYILDYVTEHSRVNIQEKKSIDASFELRGGGIGIARIFVYFACLCATTMLYTDHSNKSNEEYLSLNNTTYNVYSRNMGQTLIEKHKSTSLSKILDEQSNKKETSPLNAISESLNIKNALKKRNQLTEKKAGLWKRLLNGIYKIIPTASEEMEQYVKDYNQILLNIGQEAGDMCNQMMKMSYDNNVFMNFRFMHEAESIEKKYMQLQKEKNEYMDTLNEKKGKTLISSLFSIVTGDILTPTSYIMDIASSWKVKPSNVLSREDINAISNMEKFTFDKEELTEQEKEKISKNIYRSSSQYCIQSFGMELKYQNDQIQLKGDKINLLSVIKLLETIKTNVHIKKMTYENEEKRKQIYESLKQKMNALIYIAERMNDMVTHEMHTILKDKIKVNVEDPLSGVYGYLNNEAEKLNKLVKLSKTEFPKDIEEEEEIRKVNTAFIEIEREYTKEEIRINHFQSEQIKKRAQMDAELFLARMEAFTKLYLSMPVYSFMHSATNVASQIIKAPIIEGSYQMFDTIRSIFREILKEGDTASYLILSGLMLTFIFMVSVVTHTIHSYVVEPFTKSAKMTVNIVSFPFKVIYKLTKVPFGIVQTDAITIYDKNMGTNNVSVKKVKIKNRSTRTSKKKKITLRRSVKIRKLSSKTQRKNQSKNQSKNPA